MERGAWAAWCGAYAPGVSGQAVVELVVPPLAALLAVPPGHVLRDLRPLLRAWSRVKVRVRIMAGARVRVRVG